MITIYGIKNCDTIKKTLKWCTENGVDYQFHDYRKDGLSAALLARLEQHLGWEKLLNKRGTTYRQLSDEQKQNIDLDSAIKYMLDAPAMIKRPVVQVNDQYHVGFDIKILQGLVNE